MLSLVDFSSFQQLVTISSSGSSTVGEIYLLICTATLVDPVPLLSDVPSPTFEWFFWIAVIHYLSEASIVGQKDYSRINGAENLNPSISYQWTKNNGTQIYTQTGSDPSVLSFSHFRLSDVGEYTCQATISSPYLHDITVIASQHVAIQSEVIIILLCFVQMCV